MASGRAGAFVPASGGYACQVPVSVRTDRGSAYLLAVVGMALFGSATPISRLVGQAYPAMLASGIRMFTAALVLVPLLAIRRVAPEHPVPRLSRRDVLMLAAIAVVGTFGFTLLLFHGMRQAPGAVGAVVMATTPAVTGIGAVLFLHERLRGGRLVGLGLAVAGVLVVNLTGSAAAAGDAVWLGTALVFGAVCCEAAYTLLGKKLTGRLSPLAIAAWASVGAAALFTPFALAEVARFDLSAPTASDWLAVLWWGAATMGLGSVLWFKALERLPGGTASGFMAVMPVSALVLSYVLLGEQFSWWHVAGMAVVLAGLAVVVGSDRRPAGRADSSPD